MIVLYLSKVSDVAACIFTLVVFPPLKCATVVRFAFHVNDNAPSLITKKVKACVCHFLSNFYFFTK